MTHHDLILIERLSGLEHEATLARAFRARPEARRNAELSYHLLLHPEDPGPVTLAERRAVAGFVALLHGEEATQAHFLDLLRQTAPDLAPHVLTEATTAARPGPYGRFPPGPLSAEDLDGPVYRTGATARAALGERLSAALEHAHLLTLHPRDATSEALDALLKAGWSTSGVVVLSQLVSFLSFQIRVVAGLRSYVAARQSDPVAVT